VAMTVSGSVRSRPRLVTLCSQLIYNEVISGVGGVSGLVRLMVGVEAGPPKT